jgi:hypothetical protein
MGESSSHKQTQQGHLHPPRVLCSVPQTSDEYAGTLHAWHTKAKQGVPFSRCQKESPLHMEGACTGTSLAHTCRAFLKSPHAPSGPPAQVLARGIRARGESTTWHEGWTSPVEQGRERRAGCLPSAPRDLSCLQEGSYFYLQ